MTDNKQVRAMMWASALQGAMAADKDCVFKPDDLAKYAGGRAEALYKKWQSVVGAECGVEEEVVKSSDTCLHGGKDYTEEPCCRCANNDKWEPKQ